MGDDDTPEPTKPDDLNVDRRNDIWRDVGDVSESRAVGDILDDSTESISDEEAEGLKKWVTAKNNEDAAEAEAKLERAAERTEKKLARGKLAKKRTKRRKGFEPWDEEADAAAREAEGLPEPVIGTMEIDKKVILGFNYPPAESDGEDDDSEDEIVGPFGFLDKAAEWFRRAPVMGTIILVFGTAVIAVPIVLLSLDGGSTEVDPSAVEIIDDVEADSGDDTDAIETESDDQGSGDTGAEESSGESPTESDAVDTNAGIYLGTAVAQDPCGPQEYDVNVRFTWFGNGQVVGEQLYTPNGNAFDTTEGNWEETVAILISEAQIWVMTAGERPRLHNAYLPEGQLAPRVPDFGELVEGMTDEEFGEAFGLGDDACVPVLTDVMLEYTPFPPSN